MRKRLVNYLNAGFTVNIAYFFSNYNGGIAIHSHLKTMIYNVFNIVFALMGVREADPRIFRFSIFNISTKYLINWYKMKNFYEFFNKKGCVCTLFIKYYFSISPPRLRAGGRLRPLPFQAFRARGWSLRYRSVCPKRARAFPRRNEAYCNPP